ncbi:MAG: hypothetical protein J6I55_05145 [Ruminococcus sp.]|nr:hypothetical protein [Ruminococcus sp.]
MLLELLLGAGAIALGYNSLKDEESRDKTMKFLHDSSERNCNSWEEKMKQAERDYDAGRISYEQYSQIFDKYSAAVSSYVKASDTYEKYKAKRNG